MTWLIILGVVALIAVGVVVAHIAAGKRREELFGWATLNGLQFSAARDPGIEMEFPFFSCLSRGDNRHARNVIRGTWKNRAIAAFDYHYETESQDSDGRRTTHHHSLTAIILMCGFPVKNMHIREEGVMDRITAVFGADDIDFESAEFSRRFHVKAQDRKWAYDILHPRAMELLMASPAFNIEFSAQFVIAWRDRMINVPELEQAATLVNGLLDLVPGYVMKEQSQA